MTQTSKDIARNIDNRLRVLGVERSQLEAARAQLTGRQQPRLSVNGRRLGRPPRKAARP